MREFTSYKTLPFTKRVEFLWRGYLPPRCQYVYAGASDVDPDKKIVTCQHPRDETATFPLEYDELIVCTGATTNTFNTEGVDKYCHYLKETGDATLIRQAVLHNLERASLPHVTEEEQKRLLSFLVVGGGPTGVEVAAELQDFLVHDVVNPTHSQYHRLNGMTSITLVQSNKNRKCSVVSIHICVFTCCSISPTFSYMLVLPGYPNKIQTFSEDHMRSSGINLLTEARVKAVTQDSVKVLDKKTNELTSLPYGIVVWATGVSPGKFVKELIAKIPEDFQTSYRSLQTDKHCRVLGLDNIWAIGDCADIDLHAEYRANAVGMWKALPKETIKKEERLTMESNMTFLKELRRKFAAGELVALNDGSGKLLNKIIKDLESQHAEASKNTKRFAGLSKTDVTKVVKKHFSRQRYLPATAQVASQQGAWLASILNDPKVDESGKWTFDHTPAFDFKNKGQLVYVGSHMAAMSVPAGNDYDVTWNGSLTNYIWHAAYFGMNESASARFELFFDWMKTYIFGRSTALSSLVTSDSRSEIVARTSTLQPDNGLNGGPLRKPKGWFW
jgi:NADH:ubiquinone reductase (non-electrogenic)